jgi:hypothetical protein
MIDSSVPTPAVAVPEGPKLSGGASPGIGMAPAFAPEPLAPGRGGGGLDRGGEGRRRTEEPWRPRRESSAVAVRSFPLLFASLCVAGWVVCFATGAVINSQPYRDFLNQAVLAPGAVVAGGATSGGPVGSTGAGAAAVGPGAGAVDAKPRSGEGATGGAATGPFPLVTRDEAEAIAREAARAEVSKERFPVATGPVSAAATVDGMRRLFSWAGLASIVMVVLTFTPPNLALLGALAAVAGAAGRWMTDGTSTEESASAAAARRHAMTLRGWASSAMLSALSRGFFVYLAMLSGLLILTGDPFDRPTPGQYVRLAGTCSLFCFIVGWQPDLLKKLMDRIMSVAHVSTPDVHEVRVTETKSTSVAEIKPEGSAKAAAVADGRG